MRQYNRIHPRLKDYDYSQNGAYFVTICCKNHRCLLGDIVGRAAHSAPQMELSSYGEVVERYIKTIPGVVKYVIMPNHVHLIISIVDNDGVMRASRPTQSVSTRIRSMKTLVTKSLGQSIWQTSFHDRIIRDEEEYRMIWRYIDENPLKWELDKYYAQR